MNQFLNYRKEFLLGKFSFGLIQINGQSGAKIKVHEIALESVQLKIWLGQTIK